MNENGSIALYIPQLIKLQMQLEEMDEIVSQGELMFVMFNGLPTMNTPMIQALQDPARINRPQTKQTEITRGKQN